MSKKIFCIGLNKTGTTSMENYFRLIGYNVHNQHNSEILFHNILTKFHKTNLHRADFHRADFKFLTSLECRDVFNHIEQYDFFQDIPFSSPYFYRILLEKYPDSKFVFTVRKDGEEWANSLINFHTGTFGKGIITNHEGYNTKNIYWYNSIICYFFMSIGFTYHENWYNKQKLIKFYDDYINTVTNEFKHNKNFLLLDINNPDKTRIIEQFLHITTNDIKFPHLMQTKNKM